MNVKGRSSCSTTSSTDEPSCTLEVASTVSKTSLAPPSLVPSVYLSEDSVRSLPDRTEKTWYTSKGTTLKAAAGESSRTAATQQIRNDSMPSLQYDADMEEINNSVHASKALSESMASNNENPNRGDRNDKHLIHPLVLQVNNFRDVCGAIVNDDRTQLVIIIMIVINAIMMGIGTMDFVEDNAKTEKAFEATDKAFLLVFTIEIAMQLVYYGLHLFTDGWLVFDFIIVVASWSLEELQIVRAFRIFRAFRLVTRLDVLKNLVMALFAVAPSMAAIICLLVLILYIYAVMCTELFKDLYAEGVTEVDYFGRLDLTLFTLFEMMTLEWADIVRQVMEKYSWAWAVFNSFLVFTSFMLYSLIIAVVCDAVKVTEHSDEAAKEQEEKEETRMRVVGLSDRLDDMTMQQANVLTALRMALEQVEELNNHDRDKSRSERTADGEILFRPATTAAPMSPSRRRRLLRSMSANHQLSRRMSNSSNNNRSEASVRSPVPADRQPSGSSSRPSPRRMSNSSNNNRSQVSVRSAVSRLPNLETLPRRMSIDRAPTHRRGSFTNARQQSSSPPRRMHRSEPLENGTAHAVNLSDDDEQRQLAPSEPLDTDRGRSNNRQSDLHSSLQELDRLSLSPKPKQQKRRVVMKGTKNGHQSKGVAHRSVPPQSDEDRTPERTDDIVSLGLSMD